jgi:hypothetical protein
MGLGFLLLRPDEKEVKDHKHEDQGKKSRQSSLGAARSSHCIGYTGKHGITLLVNLLLRKLYNLTSLRKNNRFLF